LLSGLIAGWLCLTGHSGKDGPALVRLLPVRELENPFQDRSAGGKRTKPAQRPANVA